MEHLSREEIMQDLPYAYDAMLGKEVPLSERMFFNKDVSEAMDIYSRQMAIGFAEWVDNNYWFQHDDTKLWGNSASLELPENITSEQLYELYIQSLNK